MSGPDYVCPTALASLSKLWRPKWDSKSGQIEANIDPKTDAEQVWENHPIIFLTYKARIVQSCHNRHLFVKRRLWENYALSYVLCFCVSECLEMYEKASEIYATSMI